MQCTSDTTDTKKVLVLLRYIQFTKLFIYLLHLFTCLLILVSICLFLKTFINSFIHLFVHLFIVNPFIYSFIYYVSLKLTQDTTHDIMKYSMWHYVVLNRMTQMIPIHWATFLCHDISNRIFFSLLNWLFCFHLLLFIFYFLLILQH